MPHRGELVKVRLKTSEVAPALAHETEVADDDLAQASYLLASDETGVYAVGAHATPGSQVPFVGLSAALVAQLLGRRWPWWPSWARN